jgi:hypothetical protein
LRIEITPKKKDRQRAKLTVKCFKLPVIQGGIELQAIFIVHLRGKISVKVPAIYRIFTIGKLRISYW